ncbi:embryo-specific protein ATS3B-like isoform X5 [Glycine soja]|uniref:Embryo-specific protein ATS3B isoform C n=2 Tax=Glycine soja TaxID=3848 RepID=A0A445IFA9_GLYSO|nr:embryo-specific protein ATS3B-like isoform X5 [Glycine soja]XP_040864506.1 embryo-specific protein ATS3B isoform X4 [Glycine max]RZB84733.1 Embryo-specific protein ATS3B isoform C [Glycine soja]
MISVLHKTMDALNLTLILTFCIIAALSQATHHLAIKSSKLNQTQQQLDEGCSYVATIKTSCSSTFYARGEIDLIFGDAYGNQHGACTHQICHLQLYWTGDSDLILETVSIYNHLDDPVTFYYHTVIPPAGGPYGFDDCHDY